MDNTFSEVWTEAHRERGQYFVSILSGVWSLLRARRLKAKALPATAYDIPHGELAKAA